MADGCGIWYFNAARPVIALAAGFNSGDGFRLIDRFGKGIRTAAERHYLAESTDTVGRAFSFHRAMDTLGAVAGPAAAFSPRRFQNDYRKIFWLSMIQA
ncbi:MAG: hypothetical protein R2874_07925 [Desulfobacterales bacterium]